MKNLQRVSYEQVRRKMEPRVDEETWNGGIGMLNPTPTDAVSCRYFCVSCQVNGSLLMPLISNYYSYIFVYNHRM